MPKPTGRYGSARRLQQSSRKLDARIASLLQRRDAADGRRGRGERSRCRRGSSARTPEGRPEGRVRQVRGPGVLPVGDPVHPGRELVVGRLPVLEPPEPERDLPPADQVPLPVLRLGRDVREGLERRDPPGAPEPPGPPGRVPDLGRGAEGRAVIRPDRPRGRPDEVGVRAGAVRGEEHGPPRVERLPRPLDPEARGLRAGEVVRVDDHRRVLLLRPQRTTDAS